MVNPNINASNELEDKAFAARIENLFWLASQVDSYEFKEKLNEMPEHVVKKLFPELNDLFDFAEDDEVDFDVAPEYLKDANKLGFFAEIHVPIMSNFTFDGDNNPKHWSASRGHCRICYCYAETTEQLIDEIIKEAKGVFDSCVKKQMDKTHTLTKK